MESARFKVLHGQSACGRGQLRHVELHGLTDRLELLTRSRTGRPRWRTDGQAGHGHGPYLTSSALLLPMPQTEAFPYQRAPPQEAGLLLARAKAVLAHLPTHSPALILRCCPSAQCKPGANTRYTRCDCMTAWLSPSGKQTPNALARAPNWPGFNLSSLRLEMCSMTCSNVSTRETRYPSHRHATGQLHP